VTIWADGDSLPEGLRRVIEGRASREASRAEAQGRAAEFGLVYVASRMLRVSRAVDFVLVEAGPDSADGKIVELSISGDIAITRDLPLAEILAAKGLVVLNDRGDVFTIDTIRERRSIRDSATALRALGLAPESPRTRTWGPRELKAFADAFDRELTRVLIKAREAAVARAEEPGAPATARPGRAPQEEP
jgi:uncharacterized protein YaiI (UPF0178 family)